MTSVFRATPRPDSEVIELLERTLAAARRGCVRTVSIIAVNPVNEVEALLAGDLSHVRSTALLGGLVRAKLDLATRK